MAQSSVMNIGVSGVTILINYHIVTKRIQSVEWEMASGWEGRTFIWDTDIDLINPVYDSGLVIGPDVGNESIPGTYFMVDDGLGNDVLPDTIKCRFLIWSV